MFVAKPYLETGGMYVPRQTYIPGNWRYVCSSGHIHTSNEEVYMFLENERRARSAGNVHAWKTQVCMFHGKHRCVETINMYVPGKLEACMFLGKHAYLILRGMCVRLSWKTEVCMYSERHILRESWETDYRYNRDRGTHASGHICTWNRRKHNALVPGPCRWVCAWETWNHFHTTRLQRCCSTCHWCKSCRQFQTKSQKGTFLSLKETLFCEAYAYLKIGAASFTHDLHSHIHINIFHWREPVFKIQMLKNQKKSIPKVKVKKQTRKFQKVNKKQFAQIRLSII